jgi:rhodanese-related sulfurtransferase
MNTHSQASSNAEVILDVREKDEFEAEHIEGSIHLPLSHFGTAAPGVLHNLSDRSIILMCRSGNRARLAKEQIVSLGFGETKTAVYEGGIRAWKETGKPTVAMRKGHLPIMRQVQTLVGAFTLLFSILAWLISPMFLFGAAFFGAGLLVAGATGFCGMAELLAKLPWNRTNPTNREELCTASPASGACSR